MVLRVADPSSAGEEVQQWCAAEHIYLMYWDSQRKPSP